MVDMLICCNTQAVVIIVTLFQRSVCLSILFFSQSFSCLILTKIVPCLDSASIDRILEKVYVCYHEVFEANIKH